MQATVVCCGRKPLFAAAAKYLMALFLCLALSPMPVRADVSLLLMEALGVAGEASSAGHVAIYFSNICADNPVQLRLCQPGEMGVVISLYPEFGADKHYEWIAVPLIPFLYGVENEQDLPLYVNGKVRTLTRETYRRNSLRGIVPDRADGVMPEGRWQQMIGSAYNRDIFSITLKTTAAEDAALIEKLNSAPNENRFNILYHNCADFARDVVNTYFPHAAHRDALNDFTMTSPKAVARSLTRYASKRPERLLTITQYAQLAGPIRRSMDNRNYSEWAFTSKKYLIPQILFQQYLIAFFATSYFTVGRFNIHQMHVAYATPEIARLNLEESRASARPQLEGGKESLLAGPDLSFPGTDGVDLPAGPKEIENRKEAERFRIFGAAQTWENYRASFAPLLQKAIADGLFADEKEVKTFFKDLELQSEPAFDARGAMVLRVNAYGEDQTLGLTRDNILSDQSNPQLAYKLMLAKINAALKAKEKNREPFATFEADWDLLMRLSARSAETFQPLSSRPARFRTIQEKTTFGEKVKKVFVIITH